MYPASPYTVVFRAPRPRARINVHALCACVQNLMYACLVNDFGVLEGKTIVARWNIILCTLMLFDIQLLQFAYDEDYGVYYLKYRGRLYTSVPVVIRLPMVLDLNELARENQLTRTLLRSRFHQLREWHGLEEVVGDVTCVTDHAVALEEAIALLDLTEVD